MSRMTEFGAWPQLEYWSTGVMGAREDGAKCIAHRYLAGQVLHIDGNK